MLALDDRGPESLLRETVCEWWAGLPRTNDNRVEFLSHGSRPCVCYSWFMMAGPITEQLDFATSRWNVGLAAPLILIL